MQYIKTLFFRHPLLSLAFFYFFVRFTNLTSLPLFNDESIYLDWGWRETHNPGRLFYSLYDAKQPLLMWFFGMMQTILPDQVFAGRAVSVIAGYATMTGIFFLSRLVFSTRIAYASSMLYIAIPIFSFYDRQALMESAIAAVGVWSCYFLLRLHQVKQKKHAFYLGSVLGIGFMIKSTALIFLFTTIAVLLAMCFFKKEKLEFATRSIVKILSCFLLINTVLFLQPQFWSTYHTNSRYAYTIGELLRFPLSAWVSNISGILEISFVYVTPLVFVAGLSGIALMARKKSDEKTVILLWFLFSLLFQLLIAKTIIQRYIVAFLPLFTVFAVAGISSLRAQQLKSFVLLLCLLSAGALTMVQVFYPIRYFQDLKNVTRFSESYYVSGFTSGYGLHEIVRYLSTISEKKPIYIGVADNAGNPESAMHVYFHKNMKVSVASIGAPDSAILEYDCLRLDRELYFVARDEQLNGLNKFFKKEYVYANPIGENRITIYKLNDRCKGKTLDVGLIKT